MAATDSTAPSEHRDLIVIGASAGGVEALRQLLGDLPADLPAAVLVVVHLPASAVSALPAVLARASKLHVLPAASGSALQPGHVLVGVPDHHLVVRDGVVHLGRGPRENGHRPAVDPLFRSAARWHGRHVVAVILSGALDDGAAGELTVEAHGGTVAVQHPHDAMYEGMPSAALRAVPTAIAEPLDRLSDVLVRLVTEPLPDDQHPRPALDDQRRLAVETALAELDNDALHDPDRPGTPAGLGCPDCHGALFEIEENSFIRYRCRTGHAWSPESLLVEQSEELEGALWAALRALEDRAALHRRLAAAAREAGRATVARSSEQEAHDVTRSAELIRELLVRNDGHGGLHASSE